MLSRLLVPVALCATLVAAPAFADRGHKRHHHHKGYYTEVQRTVVYREPVYRMVPAPVYLGAPVVVAPPAYYHGYGRPVHHHHHGCGHDDDAWKWIGGGMLMGAILHDIYD